MFALSLKAHFTTLQINFCKVRKTSAAAEVKFLPVSLKKLRNLHKHLFDAKCCNKKVGKACVRGCTL